MIKVIFFSIAAFFLTYIITQIVHRYRIWRRRAYIAQKEVYDAKRSRLFFQIPNELNVCVDEKKPYGAVMECRTGRYFTTIASFATGDARVYLSSGKGLPGGIGHETVKKAGINFVDTIEHTFAAFKKAEHRHLPRKGYICFYAITNRGLYSCEDRECLIQDPHHRLFTLYSAAQSIITAYRKV